MRLVVHDRRKRRGPAAGERPLERRNRGNIIVRKTRRKLARIAAREFPLNAVRVRALRAAGYTVGAEVYIGDGLVIGDDLDRLDCGLTIGDRVAIGQGVLIVLASYPNASRLQQWFPRHAGEVRIADDAWIGAGAIILPDVRIGEASVIGAGSVVTRDVPPWTVVAGNPARVLRAVRDKPRTPSADRKPSHGEMHA
jgi:acetyltransferase-like isoleucine patch superfamily enzyme